MAHQEVRGRLDAAGDFSSRPKWPEAPPLVGSGFRRLFVAGIGDAAEAVCASWVAQAGSTGSPGVERIQYSNTVDPEVLASDLVGRLVRAGNGTQLAVAGPEYQVLTVERDATAAGAIPAELVLHATSTDVIRIYCPHCRATTVAQAGPGSLEPCGSCARRLSVRDHFSHRHAAYLGSDIDAGALA